MVPNIDHIKYHCKGGRVGRLPRWSILAPVSCSCVGGLRPTLHKAYRAIAEFEIAAIPLVVLTWVVYLSLPFSLHPTFVILPFAMLFALAVTVTASTFKKYL